MKTIIISRHAAAIQFIAQKLAGPSIAGESPGYAGCSLIYDRHGNPVHVLAVATPEDVRGAVVYGNLPLHLAALAAEVHVVEFEGTPPRGQEYTLADMEAAGAVIRAYTVTAK